MTTENKLGIWMNHTTANLIEFTVLPMTTHTLTSAFTHEEKEDALSKSEHIMHNKEQQQQDAFYKQLAKAIKPYTDVLLFGPTDAKVELSNLLKADHHFDNIKIHTMQADKMTEPQQHAFVRDYFTKHKSL
jgi:hypothetical protein